MVYLKAFWVFVLVIAMAWAMKYSRQPTARALEGPENCVIQDGQCEFILDNERVLVSFSPKPQIEEPLTIRFAGDSLKPIRSIHIEGANMYMGKTPVVAESQEKNKWKGWTMLGACSEPNMTWNMVVTFEDATTSLIQFQTRAL
ncbi:hypothetical protein DRW07_07695 [Alteromonas sediminis]|uniref:Uncharacterized protein n=1 Tax=Alteromonas sediminis TaxID=2259342 RepID=A0A3N5ZC61_9ALTE|nr:hypothetical protein [Alteromonas sediminis]RPJ67398.1 hypothetical protein DRW07_07695 [Alteromonas sediminis]